MWINPVKGLGTLCEIEGFLGYSFFPLGIVSVFALLIFSSWCCGGIIVLLPLLRQVRADALAMRER